jgi:hypothetical protein
MDITTITVDKTGFPVIQVPGTNLSIHWLPVTKIQFEHFMVDTGRFDYDWYNAILTSHNSRISPGGMVSTANYWKLFMTGILPGEAQTFAGWFRDYDLPTAEEWKRIVTALAVPQQPGLSEKIKSVAGISERARAVIDTLDRVLAQDAAQLIDGRKVCDQMAMRLGVIEYVYENNQHNTFVGWGQPNRRFVGGAFNPIRDSRPVTLHNPATGARIPQWGFRLVKRG